MTAPTRQNVDRSTWEKAIRASDLSPQARLVAMTLASWMRADGSGAYPGQETLALACGWTNQRTARRAIAELDEAGYVDIGRYAGVRQRGRSQATHRYVPTVPGDGPAGHISPGEHGDQPDTHALQEAGDQAGTSARENTRPAGHTRPSESARPVGHKRTTSRTFPATSRTPTPDKGSSLEDSSLEASRVRARATPPWNKSWKQIETYIRRYGALDPDKPPLELDPRSQAALTAIGGINAVRRSEVNAFDFRDAIKDQEANVG